MGRGGAEGSDEPLLGPHSCCTCDDQRSSGAAPRPSLARRQRHTRLYSGGGTDGQAEALSICLSLSLSLSLCAATGRERRPLRCSKRQGRERERLKRATSRGGEGPLKEDRSSLLHHRARASWDPHPLQGRRGRTRTAGAAKYACFGWLLAGWLWWCAEGWFCACLPYRSGDGTVVILLS